MLNAVVDFMLLMGTNALAGFPSDWKRNLPAAALGGLYGGICLLPEFRFLGGILWRMVFLGLIGFTAFGWNRGSLKRTGIFLLLSMAMGGIAMGMGKGGIASLICSGGAIWLLCKVAFGDMVGGKSYVPVTIRYGSREVRVLALRDTGNSLTDPVTGERVLVLGTTAAMNLTGLTRQQLLSPLETMAKGVLPGLRLIPYRAVGNANGMMLAVKMDRVWVGNREIGNLVAFAPQILGAGEFQALAGGVL